MQKDYLKEISAVQTLLILKGAKIEFKEMFKFILLDLLLKKVFTLEDEWLKSHSRDPYLRRFTSLNKGKLYNEYNFKSYELNFKLTSHLLILNQYY